MLLTARLTTDVSICANNTPSDVAIRTRRECRRSSEQVNHVETRVMAFFSMLVIGQARPRRCTGWDTPEFPTRFLGKRWNLAEAAMRETNVFNRMEDKY